MLILKKIINSTFIQKNKIALLTFIHLQLFLTICSLPLLSVWGLPVSALSIVGNFLFAPFMTGYLFLSLLFFISEFLFIPNHILLIIIEKYTNLWILFLSYNDASVLVQLPHSGLAIYNLATISAIIILFSKIKSIAIRISGYIALLLFCLTYSSFAPSKVNRPLHIIHDHASIILKEYDNKKVLCCFDTLAQQGSEKFIRYTLYNKLNGLGIKYIPFVITSNNSTGTYRALTALLNQAKIGNIFITKPSKNHQKITFHWNKLLEIACNLKVNIHILPKNVLIELEQLFMHH